MQLVVFVMCSECAACCHASVPNSKLYVYHPQEPKTEAQKILEETEALMQAMASGNYKPKPKAASQSVPEPTVADAPLDPSTGLRLHCDVNGCVIVPLSAKQHRNGLTGS